MSVKDLVKYGYVVALRDGTTAILMPSKEGDYLDFCNKCACLPFCKYDENLNYGGLGDNRYNIMKIFGYSSFGYRTVCNEVCNRDLIWERKDEFSVESRVKIVNMNNFNDRRYILLNEYIGKTGKIVCDWKSEPHSYKIQFDKEYMNAIDDENGNLLFGKENIELI